jgi:hypothetical protein
VIDPLPSDQERLGHHIGGVLAAHPSIGEREHLPGVRLIKALPSRPLGRLHIGLPQC